MFSKLAALTLILPFVSALTVDTPKNVASNGPVTITWSTASGDPSTFSIELVNEVFHNSYAIANNVQASAGTISLTIPSVPSGDGYTIEFVDIGNINNIYGTSGGFSVAAESSSSTSASATGKSSGASGASSASHASYTAPGSSSGFGVTVTGSSTASTPSGSASGSGSASSSASSAASSSFNAAPSMKFGGSSTGLKAVAMLSVVAGAAVFAL